MKIRTSFVSNSSSSSFIVIADSYTDAQVKSIKNQLENYSEFNYYAPIMLPNQNYKYQFGWEEEKSEDFFSKLNFCFIQIKLLEEYGKQGWANYSVDAYLEYQQMLEEVIKEDFNIEMDFSMNSGFDEGEIHYYIDHQSASIEDANMEMFNDKESLRKFLYSDSSYIQTDNDNKYPESFYED